jgi:membrane protein implicated in regulation of membrane protease activity
VTIVFWYWWALAAVLLIFEMMMPGVVFLFLAIGAVASGLLLVIASGVSLEFQLFVFAIVAVASALVLRPMLRRLQTRTSDPNLNARGEAMVGRTFLLDEPLLGGRGRAKLGDGSWTITGPDMAAGAKVRVAAVSGTELRVEPTP